MNRPGRPAIVHIALGALAVLLVLKSAHLQLWKGGEMAARADRQYYRLDSVPAPRGDILDASGGYLVQSVEQLTLAVAPKELVHRDPRVTAKQKQLLEKTLSNAGVPSKVRRAALNSNGRTKWVPIQGRFTQAQLQAVRGMRGVYVEPVYLRTILASPAARAFLGSVDNSGVAKGGVESALDAALRGHAGLVRVIRNPAGTRDREVVAKELLQNTRGNTVVLSINREWQNIVEWALSSAVVDQSAVGGDIVIVNPKTGEIVAMASYDAELGFATTAMIGSPYEPGSSVKPLLASRILELERAGTEEVMETGREFWVPGRKTPITDVKPAPFRSFHDVIKYSSNIGMVKFALRLTPQEQFEAYRDFGLGMPTGITLPGEAGGGMDPGARRSQVAQVSTAIGYGMNVTSLQLAMAFASIANGGQLLEPTLVKEIRDPSGDVLFRHAPRVVRRVMSAPVAAQMRVMLRDVVQSGTATGAEISLGALAGKTGTSRFAEGGGYVAGKYIATFAGMFPASDPQFVLVVRLTDPESEYGGTAAAPVTAAVLKAAAAATGAVLDKQAFARSPSAPAGAEAERAGAGVTTLAAAEVDDDFDAGEAMEEWQDANRTITRTIDLKVGAQSSKESSAPRAVPSVRGMPLRDAVFALHRAGFRVRLSRSNANAAAGSTSPPAGSSRKPGDSIVLYAGL